MECHLCNKFICCGRNPACNARRLLDHARWHLDKPIFTCRLCQYSASTDGTIRVHLSYTHNVARSKQNFKDSSDEYREEITSMLKDCFGEKKEGTSVISRVEVRTQARIRNRYGPNSLLTERKQRCLELAQKFHQSGKLRCLLCQDQLRFETIKAPMQHAFSHFNKPTFTCRRCPYSSPTKGMMKHHVRSKHGVPITNEFDDRTDDFHSDFMDMLSKCYDWDLEPEGSICTAAVGRKSKKLCIISATHGDHLKAARRVHAYELIRKHAKEGKIICRICSHTTKTTEKGGYMTSCSAFSHAMTHLDKRFWVYRCKLCSHMSSNRSNIHHHLKIVHKEKSLKEVENMSDNFQKEIMECLSNCYDWGVFKAGEMSC